MQAKLIGEPAIIGIHECAGRAYMIQTQSMAELVGGHDSQIHAVKAVLGERLRVVEVYATVVGKEGMGENAALAIKRMAVLVVGVRELDFEVSTSCSVHLMESQVGYFGPIGPSLFNCDST
jgi:hypothetical protein